MLFIANPARRRRRGPARRNRGTAKKGVSSMRRARKHRTSARAKPRRRRRSTRRRSVAVAVRANPRKRRRHHVARRNPRRRSHRRSFRRNPPRTTIMRQVKEGLVDALWIIGGTAANDRVQGLLPATVTTSMGATGQAALKGLTGVILGYVADRFIGRNAGKMVTAATLADAIRAAIIANAPSVAPFLTGYPQSLSGYPQGLSGPALLSPGASGDFHRGLGDTMADYGYDEIYQ